MGINDVQFPSVYLSIRFRLATSCAPGPFVPWAAISFCMYTHHGQVNSGTNA